MIQDAITQHAVPVATTEEKAIDTLCELLTAPAKPKSPANKAIVHETRNHTMAPSSTNLASLGIPKHPNLCQPHIIIQDDTELDEDQPMQHQYNLCFRAHLIADSIHPLYTTSMAT